MEMIKGFAEAKIIEGKDRLPVGGYKLKIMDVEEVKTDRAHYLKISFDIADGMYIGYYADDYRNQTTEDKRWKGVTNIFIPKEGDTYYEQNLSRFKTVISNIEESNGNYHWDWNEKGLKDKLVGGVFGEEEWEYDGKSGMRTSCRYLTSISAIEEEKFKIPAPKYKNGSSATTSAETKPAFVLSEEDDDLPF